MEALGYKQPGMDDTRFRRQLNFWQLWALAASGLCLFLVLVMSTTGLRFWVAAVREFLHQLFGVL